VIYLSLINYDIAAFFIPNTKEYADFVMEKLLYFNVVWTEDPEVCKAKEMLKSEAFLTTLEEESLSSSFSVDTDDEEPPSPSPPNRSKKPGL